jgi:hypothetical protein
LKITETTQSSLHHGSRVDVMILLIFSPKNGEKISDFDTK